jgi:hypothetical protein
VLPLVWWGGALWVGASLVACAPRRGMAACASLAVGGEALLIGLGGPAVWSDPGNGDFVLFCTTALIAPMPLLIGAAVARRRLVACAALLGSGSMTHRLAYALCGLLAVATPPSPQQTDWKGPSPHVVKLVTVDTDVQLEVLDWGGSGPAPSCWREVVLRRHVFDDLAPTLAARVPASSA